MRIDLALPTGVFVPRCLETFPAVLITQREAGDRPLVKTSVTLTRREFVISGVALALASAIPGYAVDTSLEAWLQESVGHLDLPRGHDRAGEPGTEIRERLESISEWIRAEWSLEDHSTVDADGLLTFLSQKTREVPSYLYEYSQAVEVFAAAEKELGSASDAIRLLVLGGLSESTAYGGLTRIGAFRAFVSDELIILHVVRGGFKRFGYRNYDGFIGGPFTDPSNLPYRGRAV